MQDSEGGYYLVNREFSCKVRLLVTPGVLPTATIDQDGVTRRELCTPLRFETAVFPVPMSGGTQPPVTLAPRGLTSSSVL